MSKRKVALHIDVNTSHNKEAQRVIRINAVEIINGKEGKRFSHVINPEEAPITPNAKAYHHLTDAKVAKGSKFADIADDFLAFINDATVVLHTPFTHHILNLEFDRLKMKHLKEQCRKVEYASDLFKKLHPDAKGMCKLGSIASEYKVRDKTEIKKLVKVILAMSEEKEAIKAAKVKAEADLKDDISPQHKSAPSKTNEKTTTNSKHDEKKSVVVSKAGMFAKKAAAKPSAKPVMTTGVKTRSHAHM